VKIENMKNPMILENNKEEVTGFMPFLKILELSFNNESLIIII
jgi:hypothetical protein